MKKKTQQSTGLLSGVPLRLKCIEKKNQNSCCVKKSINSDTVQYKEGTSVFGKMWGAFTAASPYTDL